MREIAVHPNSMAARRWKRTTWRTSLSERELQPAGPAGMPARRREPDPADALFRRAAIATRRGQHELASALRSAAMRARSTEHHCG